LISAYNEEKIIAKKLENALSIDYPIEMFQILVAADGSSDKTPEIVRTYKNDGVDMNYIPDRYGKMAALNRAIPIAKGEIIVFSDANNMYEKNTIRALVAPFSDLLVGASTGSKLIIDDGRELSSAEGLYWKYESSIKINETKLGSCTSSVGEILAIRKSLFIAPQDNIINDDHYIVLDLIHRGYRVAYIPAARSFEYTSNSLTDEKERRKRMNAGLYQTISMSGRLLPFNRPLILWEILSHKYFRAFIPFAMILALLSNLSLVLWQHNSRENIVWDVSFKFALVLFIFQLIFYILAFLGNMVKSKGWMRKIVYLPSFLVNSNLATLAGLYTFMTDRQAHLWKRVRR
jgi:cellulose synthase/poly-beta-1,6-N-acetylglucosamine synthase-like glycosyltransferase